MWMMLDEGFGAFFRRGVITPHTYVFSFTSELREQAGESAGPKMDQKIREHFDPLFAAKLVGKKDTDQVNDEPTEWDETDEPHAVSAGFFLYATELDWEAGTLVCDHIPTGRDRPEFMFWDDEQHLGSEFERPDFHVSLGGLSFEANAVEMLLPTASLSAPAFAVSRQPQRGVGRPPKWDWEGALAHIIAGAQHPDGLPVGPGSQARIEAMIAEWFTEQVGNAPAVSQVRQRAQAIIRQISAKN